MNLDAGDIAVVGGGGTAALGFVLGVVTRYVSPRLSALSGRIEKLESGLGRVDEKHDLLLDRVKEGLLEQREITGKKVTEVLLKLDAELADLRMDISTVREGLGYLRGKTTKSGSE